ncbi:MAG: type IV secretion system DNA-binding domain-containing protein [Chitinophagaceae bacterium]|nr:type IV secretion system DNA-binding domain-containing protein [Chitinophagaceae bacterium]
MRSLKEQLTIQFYEWERLGRGWIYAAAPVDIEPPFTPFLFHRIPSSPPVHDDGAHHTVLSKVASVFQKKKEVPQLPQYPQVTYDPYAFTDNSPLATFRLHIPKGYRGDSSGAIAFLVMLSYCTSPVSVEYIADHASIRMQISCRERYAAYVKGHLRTYFPEIGVSDVTIALTDFINEEQAIAVTDFGLQDECMRPLVGYSGSGIDPLTGIISILEQLREDEEVIAQILLNGVVNQWEQSMLRAVSDGRQGPFFEDAPEMLPMAKEKVSTPLFAATLRLYTQAKTQRAALSLLEKLCFAVTQASRSAGNALIPLPDEGYTIDQRVTDIAFRESHRLGMLLNAKELATFVHIPTVQSKKLYSSQRKTKAAPAITRGHQLILGRNEHEGSVHEVSVSSEQRLRHTHIIGATGTGKSTLLYSMIAQDIAHGNGIAVLDPHGDLIESVLKAIPERRIKDVLIIDPSDSEYPVGFNILRAHSDVEKEVLSSDLVALFKRTSTSWGDQMNSVFGNVVIAFLESSTGGTLAELRRFLIEKSFRDEFLCTVQDPAIRYYWQKEYPLLKTNSVGPILTRLDSFLRPKLIRNMVCQERGLDFEQILASQKILLVKLSQGLIGTENSYLLGSFVVSKIHQAALARQASEDRTDFFVYIDEFQHFVTPSMAGMLSGARKYHVGLILAHQDMQQLQKSESEIASSVIANAGTRICFRVGETDAKRLSDSFSSFDEKDLLNLEAGQAIMRIEKPGFDCSLDTIPIQKEAQSEKLKQKIIDHSRHLYSVQRVIVEHEVSKGFRNEYEEKRTSTPNHDPLPQPKADIPALEKRVEQAAAPLISNEKPVVIPSTKRTSEESESIIRRKEESQHRYLQTLIKKMAEARGYKATIEAVTPDGGGKVDVLLEKDAHSIACEISVTTDTTWELHNLEKCLTAGYDCVVSCVTDKKSLSLLQKKIRDCFSEVQRKKITILEPDAFIGFLDSMAEVETTKEISTTYKGYRVKVSYDSLTREEMQRKRESVARIIMNSLRAIKR